MSHQSYRPPKLTSIIGGIIVAVLLLISMCMLGSVVKALGTAVFYVPARLGLFDQVRAADVVELDMLPSNSVLAFSLPGRYHVYTADLDLLETAAALGVAGAKPWLTILSVRSGEEVPVDYVTRGVRPYDSPHAPGRPVLSFTISTPGEYALRYPSRQTTLAIVPDHTTGRERELTLTAIAEVALLVGGGAWALRRRGRRRPSLPRSPE